MDRFIRACLTIFTVICGLTFIALVVAIVLVITPQLFGPDDPAIRIALSDPGVKTAIANNEGHYKIVSVTPQGQNGISGFIGISDTLVAVNMSMQGGMYGSERYIAFVDLNRSEVVSSEWYSYRGFPGSMGITLPPGGSYYHSLYGPISGGPAMGEDFGVETFWCRMVGLYPENAMLYPFVMDEVNLLRMKNGSNYEPAAYNDTNTHEQTVLNGSYPVYPGWSVNASVRRPQVYDSGNWPDFDFSRHYYIVFKNSGQDTVGMTIEM